MLVSIAIDDTDSPRGGCTTYIASHISSILDNFRGIEFLDYPLLIRLNPNIPFKTRGNGAVAFRLRVDDNIDLDDVLDLIVNIIVDHCDMNYPKTDPAIAVLVGEIPVQLTKVYYRALTEIVPLSPIKRLVERLGIRTVYWKRGKGLIGAVAALGAVLDDYTFELIAYRAPQYWGTKRVIDTNSVILIDRLFRDSTYANYDYESGRVLITPRGPDPVLLGIRGEDPEVLIRAFSLLRISEPIDRWTIFRTNQGTNAHFRGNTPFKPYNSVVVRGRVGRVRVLTGGHIVFELVERERTIECIVYKDTGRLTRVSRMLDYGDEVIVYGGVRPASSKHREVLNVEVIHVIRSTVRKIERAPLCPVCRKRMKSMGRNKGYRCPKCKYKAPKATKVIEKYPSIIDPGIYIPSPRAYRHLTRPRRRFGVINKQNISYIFKPWHYP
ncbi:MAG: hypothetical protein DRN53_05490 [Thermoprotei archaeon]|nr:MAG: hypothetical protein DRN53_05490 [Thermoprotei archaeon]